MKNIVFSILSIVILAGCTILKSDPEKKIKDFLVTFETNLNSDVEDKAIIDLFKTTQSSEAILSAVRVLRNVEYEPVMATPDFSNATILNDSLGLRVTIPVQFKVDTLTVQVDRQSEFTLWLTPTKDSFVINRLEGETLYNDFLGMSGEVRWVMDEQELLESHKRYFRAANKLREKYDTVALVATYKDVDYYYVAQGSWDLEGTVRSNIGIVDSLGHVIVPIGYDMIGNPGVVAENIVEIRRDGFNGYFDILKKKVLIDTEFEWIIPYDKGNVYALAMADTIGWINRKYEFVPGFPSDEVKQYFYSFSFIPEHIEFSSTSQTLLEIPDEKNYGSGIFITPSYLIMTGVFNPRYTDLSMDGKAYRAGTESVEGSRSVFQTVSDGINAFVTTISSRYLEGREEFYNEDQINFVDNNGNILVRASLASAEVTITKIDSTLIEVKSSYHYDPMGMGFDDATDQDMDIPRYTYYRIYEGAPVELESNRKYNFTDFIALDSSYLSGNFTYWDSEQQTVSTRSFMGNATLTEMRNDILASYGYIFPDQATQDSYKSMEGYAPTYQNFADLEPNLADVDRHNLKFLEKILGPLAAPDKV